MNVSQWKILLLLSFTLIQSAGQSYPNAQIISATFTWGTPSGLGNLRTAENSSEVRQNFKNFITAFDELDWDKFINYFSDSATVFFFFEDKPLRAAGRNEIENMFRKFFDETRNKTGGPSYLKLKPQDVVIQMLNGAAVISFYINGKFGTGRRTLVFQNIGGKWVIIHLHASNISSGNK